MRKTILGFTAFAILLLASTGFCAELLVPRQYSTIQPAIDAAVDGDIVIIEPGLYEGPNNTNLNITGKAITVQSIDPNDPWVVDNTVIDCSWSSMGFNIDADSVLEGLTITHGNHSEGGGVRIWKGSPLIRNCSIKNNISNRGGGIYVFSNDNPTIIGCSISSNHATNSGGGIFSEGRSTIIGCTITGNQASMYGGGIFCLGSSSTATITDCVIRENTANNYGGGIYCTSSGKQLKINRSSISGNITLSSGGAIYLNQGTLYISSSIVAGNFSQNNGGGVYVSGTSSGMIAEGCTFAGNTSTAQGGGVSCGNTNISANHSIFWGNSDIGGAGSSTAQINAPASKVSLQFSCIQDEDPNDADIPFGKDIDNPNTGGEENGNIDDDPLFMWIPGDYDNLHLGPDSPCIEAGNPLSIADPNATDIDGQPRIIGLVEDMGADEYGKILIATGPKEGEVWATGSKHQIKWLGFGVNNVDILLSTDNGQSWDAIAEDLTDPNSYLWDVPDYVDSNQCLISVVAGDRDPNVISIESGLFTISWYPSQPDVPPDMLRRGKLAAPTLSENQGPQLGCIKWVFDTNGPVSSQVAVTWPYWNSYGVYIGCEDGQIYALDDLGDLMWSYDINTPIVGSPAVGYYGMVYVAGQNGWLYAIDYDGFLRWTHISDGPVYSTPVVGYDGKIYLCSQDGAIYALSGNGSELWNFKTRGPAKLSSPILATPVIDKNKTVYVAGLYDANLYALDTDNGSVRWACNFDPCDSNHGQLFASPAIGPNGTIYQTLIGDQNLYAIDPCNGNILWSTSLQQGADTNASGWSSPVVGQDGTIYVSFDDPYLRAVEPNGTIKWVTRLGMVGGFTLSIDKNGLVYAASDDNFVCIVEPNGSEISRFQGNGWVTFPAIAEDGTLIVSDANNRVWALSNQDCYFQPAALHRPQDVDSGWNVNFMDFAIMANNWLNCTNPLDASCDDSITSLGIYSMGDINRDYYADYEDIAFLAANWMMEAEI